MENQFIKNSIKKNFIKKNFKEWNKDTIDYLIMITSINKFSKYHNILFLLLNEYVIWYKNNKDTNNLYTLDELTKINLYTLDELTKIKSDLYLILYNNNDYLKTINDNNINNDNNNINNDINNDINDINNNNIFKNDNLYNTSRVYINDFGEDDIIINNYFKLENIMYVIFFIIGVIILKNLFLILNYNPTSHNNVKNMNELPKSSIFSGINLNEDLFKNLNISNSNDNFMEKINKIDLLNNPIINYFLNKLF
jgi:hypothetical protein